MLAVEPLCRACAAAGLVSSAVLVDHVIAKADGGTDEMSNLQPLCDRCHREKTAAEAARGRERARAGR